MKRSTDARQAIPRKSAAKRAGRSNVKAVLRKVVKKKTAQATHRRAAQPDPLQIADSGTYLRAITDQITDGITVQSVDGRLLYANEKAAELIGFSSPQELLSASVADIMSAFELRSEDDKPFSVADMPGRRAIQENRDMPPVALRFRIKESRQDRWSVIHASPMRDEAGTVIGAINVFHDITEQKRSEQRNAFIAEASSLLASSLDYETILDYIGKLIVPRLADWFSVSLPDEHGQLRNAVVTHSDPDKVIWARQLNKERPTDMDSPTGAGAVFRTGQSEIHPYIPEEMIVKAAKNEEDLKLLRYLGLSSAITVPVIARGKTIGVLSMIYAESSRHYDNDDLLFAQDMGRRIGMAIDNARLYTEAQHELQERKRSEESFKQLAEAIPQIVWINGPDPLKPAEFVNRQWKEYAGGTTDKLRKAGVEFVLPGDRTKALELWKKVMKTGETFEYQYRLRRKDGEFRWHLTRAVPVRDEHGTIVRWFGTATDINDQKVVSDSLNEKLEQRVKERTWQLENEIDERLRVEAQDKTNLARLKNIIDKMPLGVIIYDERHQVIHANQNACHLLDMAIGSSELIGTHFNEVTDRILHHLAEPEKFKDTLFATIKSGTPNLNQELMLSNGRIILRDYMPIFSDGAYKGHVFLYRDITREKKIDATKSEFMSLASHQLRTPLTAIRWTFGRLEKHLLRQASDADRRLLEEGKKATARMSETIDTMLKISKLQSGDIRPTLSDIALADYLRETAAPYFAQSKVKHQNFLIDCPQNLCLTNDPRLLKEVVMNLYNNAVKYTPDGGTIRVTATSRDGAVHIDIADNGYGIPLYQQTKIFSKFFRGDNIVNRETEGTGLGLYLVSLIGQLIGCTIGFVSEEGKGTTFTLVFEGQTKQ